MPSLRPLRAEDIDAVLEIQRGWPALPQWTLEHFLHEARSSRAYLAVLESGGRVLGYGGLRLIAPEAQITVLAVAPEKTRGGSGAHLLRYLLEAARSAGCLKVTLEVSAGNAAALRLYSRAGFNVVGSRRKLYADGSDALLMDLALRARPSSGCGPTDEVL